MHQCLLPRKKGPGHVICDLKWKQQFVLIIKYQTLIYLTETVLKNHAFEMTFKKSRVHNVFGEYIIERVQRRITKIPPQLKKLRYDHRQKALLKDIEIVE